MAITCYDNTYVIKYTHAVKGTISIPKKSLIVDELDIALVGKKRNDYGEIFDENILHLLENFAAPESDILENTPDSDQTVGSILENPIEGQTWYNSTKKRMFVFNGTEWLPLGLNSDVGGNRGVILSGMSLPRPISPVTGYQFTYAECSWNVSTFNLPDEVDYVECLTDANGVVSMKYTIVGDATIYNGYANYQIIGIKDSTNQGSVTPIAPSGTPLPTPTNTPTPSVTPTMSVTPSVTPTITPTPTNSPIPPTPSPTPGLEYFFAANMDEAESTGTLYYGYVDPVSFGIISTATINRRVIADPITINNEFLFVPFQSSHCGIYLRGNSTLSLTNQINYTAGHTGLGVITANHPTYGQLIYVMTTPGSSTIKIEVYLHDGDTPVYLTSASIVYTGSLQPSTTRMCIFNDHLIVVTPDKIKAFYYDGISLNEQSSFDLNISNLNAGVVTDNQFLFINAFGSDRTILNFAGNTFSYAFTDSSYNAPGVVKGGYLFTGTPVIVAQSYTNVPTVGAWIDSLDTSHDLKYTIPFYKYSEGTSRLYLIADSDATNNSFSTIYVWNGTTFEFLMPFQPEIEEDRYYSAFSLGYIINSAV